ncbi:hypothetical protein PYCC9005_003506 [Savitreella phatthalungensis]
MSYDDANESPSSLPRSLSISSLEGRQHQHDALSASPARSSLGNRSFRSPSLTRSGSGYDLGAAKPVVGEIQTGAAPFPPLRIQRMSTRLGAPSPAFMRARRPQVGEVAEDEDILYDAPRRAASQPVSALSQQTAAAAAAEAAKLAQSVPPGQTRPPLEDTIEEMSEAAILSIAHTSATQEGSEGDKQSPAPVDTVAAPVAETSWLSKFGSAARSSLGLKGRASRRLSQSSSISSINTPRKAHSVEVLSAPPVNDTSILPADLLDAHDHLETPEALAEINAASIAAVVSASAATSAPEQPETGYIEAPATQFQDESLADVSFEPSFMAPRHMPGARPQLNSADVRREPMRQLSNLSEVSDHLIALPMHTDRSIAPQKRFTSHSLEGNGGFSSPIAPEPAFAARHWETPADTRRLVREAPTKTAVAKRVQELKIPAAELDMIRSSVNELDSSAAKERTKQLSVNESTQTIDALQKDNFELRLKIYFLEKQLSQEQDTDKQSLLRDNARLNVEATKLAQAAQMRERRSKALEKQVEDLEYEKMNLQRQLDGGTQPGPEDGAIDDLYLRLNEQERVILELEAAEARLRDDVRQAVARAEQAELRAKAGSVTTVRTEDLEHARQNGDRSLENPQVAAKQVLSLRKQVDSLNHELANRLEEISSTKMRAADLEDEVAKLEEAYDYAEEERNAQLQDLADKAELERREFELYIDELHAELSDSQAGIRAHEQTVARRIAEAIKPHEQAWRTVTADLNELERIVERERGEWASERRAFEAELDVVTAREHTLGSELSAARRRVRELSAEREEAEQKLQDLAQEYDDHIAATSEDLAREMKQLKMDLARARAQSVDLANELNEATRQSELLREQKRSLEVEVSSRKECLQDLQEDQETNERELADLRKAVDQRQALLDEINALADSKESERALAAKEAADARARQLVAEGEIATLEQQHAEAIALLQRQLDEHASAAVKSTAELNELVDTFIAGSEAAARLPTSASIRQKLTAVFDERDSKEAELQRQLAGAGAGQEEAVLSLAAKARLADGLERELDNLRARLESREQESSKLRKELDAREKQFASVNKALQKQHDDHDKRERDLKLSHERDAGALRSICEALDSLFDDVGVEDRPDGQSLSKLVNQNAPQGTGASPGSLPLSPRKSANALHQQQESVVQESVRLQSVAAEAARQVAQLSSKLRHKRNSTDSEARRKLSEIYTQLSKREKELARTQAKLDEATRQLSQSKQALAEAQTQAADRPKRISLPPGREPVQSNMRSGSVQGEACALVLSDDYREADEATANRGIEQATMLARIENLSRELKVVKERSNEEKLAARARLAEQKRIVADLREFQRQQQNSNLSQGASPALNSAPSPPILRRVKTSSSATAGPITAISRQQ